MLLHIYLLYPQFYSNRIAMLTWENITIGLDRFTLSSRSHSVVSSDIGIATIGFVRATEEM
jgi:hypothetical protein